MDDGSKETKGCDECTCQVRRVGVMVGGGADTMIYLTKQFHFFTSPTVYGYPLSLPCSLAAQNGQYSCQRKTCDCLAHNESALCCPQCSKKGTCN